MVDSLSVHMDGSLGRGDAASKENAKKNPSLGLHVRLRCPWIFIRHTLCTGTGYIIWPEF